MADYFCTHCGCRHEPLEHIRHVSDREKLETLAAWLTEDEFTPAEIAAQELITATKEMGASSLEGALSSETLTNLRGLVASGTEAAAAPKLLALLIRYRNETPLGNQPHMIAAEADEVIAAATGAA